MSEQSHDSASPTSKKPKKIVIEEPVDENGALIVREKNDIRLGDYVTFERIDTTREWGMALGKVVSFPSSQTLKVLYYDPCDPKTVAQDPLSEKELKEKSKKGSKKKVWEEREKQKEELLVAVKEENEALQKLFEARQETLRKQKGANSRTVREYARLKRARRDLMRDMHLWSCLRSTKYPPPCVEPTIKALMLVMKEDKQIGQWEKMTSVMCRNDFFKRLLDIDCGATPMSYTCIERVEKLLKMKVEVDEGPKNPHDHCSEGMGIYGPLDAAIRYWIEVQVALSEAGQARAELLDECFSEQLEQRVQLREINDMRVGISALERSMHEKKLLILGDKEPEVEMFKLEASDYETYRMFHCRTYSEHDSRYVNQVILRDAVVINFGDLTKSEDNQGYVRLGRLQQEALQKGIFSSAIAHDAYIMEDLLNMNEQNEKELTELKRQIDTLSSRNDLTPEQEEELKQLKGMYAERDRQYQSTLARIAHMYASSRGATDVTISEAKGDTKYVRLPLEWFGDWSSVLADHMEEFHEALRSDLDQIVEGGEIQNIVAKEVTSDPQLYQLDILKSRREVAQRVTGSNDIDEVPDKHCQAFFSSTYTGPLSEKELTFLYQHGSYPAVEALFKKVTGKRCFMINDHDQIEKCVEGQSRQFFSDLPETYDIGGCGVRPTERMYADENGSTDMRFDEETESQPDWRHCCVKIPASRVDYSQTIIPREVQHCTNYREGVDDLCAQQGIKQPTPTPTPKQAEDEVESAGTPASSADQASPEAPSEHESAHESPKEPAHESPKEPAHESPKESAHESPKESAHESPKEPAHESPKPSAHESPKESAHESPKESGTPADSQGGSAAEKPEDAEVAPAEPQQTQ